MGAPEANTTNLYGFHVRESANDGSDFSNAASDYRVLFLGEDGQLHLKDSAGAVTDIGGGSSGIPSTLLDAKGDLIAASAADTAARLAVGTNGMVLVAASGESTGLKWAWPPGHEFDYSQITTGVNVTGTAETSAGSTLLITGNAATYDGEPVIVEVFFPASRSDDTAGRDLRLGLYESTTFLGRMTLTQDAATSANSAWRPLTATYRFTPSAASHTYLIRGMVSAGTGRVEAGAAGATNYVPGYMRVVKA